MSDATPRHPERDEIDWNRWSGPIGTWPRDLFGTPVPPPGTFYEAGYKLRLAFFRLWIIAFYRLLVRPVLRRLAHR